MSEVKVNKISPRTNCGTVQLGDSGDTITIPSGATITNNGTQTGFGKTGAVDFVTTAKTSNFNATAGEGYFVNTAGGAVTATLPGSPSAGDMVVISDYNSTSSTNSITIARNSSNINGSAENLVISKPNSAIQLVYVDATTGWQSVATASPGDIQNEFVAATGGTTTTCGNFKIHTFTGPGTFTVSSAGTSAGSNSVSYLVVAGGAGGASGYGGSGGGAGGFREGKTSTDCYSSSPLNAPAGLPVSAQAYPITVGGGGAGGTNPSSPILLSSAPGANSTFSTITSAGGGGGGYTSCGSPGPQAGGSGSGANANCGSSAGAGNTPPVSPPQGNAGGPVTTPGNHVGGGGGGAGAVGGTGRNDGPGKAGDGGAGVATSITGSSVTRAGGGGAARENPSPSLAGAGGSGGGGAGGVGPNSGGSGTANTGGGGGASGGPATPFGSGGAGGSGIVVIRYKFQ